MKLSMKSEPHEMVPPAVWRQLQHAFVTIGDTYGVRVQIEGDPFEAEAIDRKWFAFVEEQLGKP